MAYRAFQRGDLLVAGILLAVGVALSVYRMGAARKLARTKGSAAAR
jgi:hypothetical protein